MTPVRKKQCPNCPWKVSTTAIPGGSCPNKDEKLDGFRQSGQSFGGSLQMMQCHDTQDDEPKACTGWVIHELGPGNNMGLRLKALAGGFEDLETVGPQRRSIHGVVYEPLEDQ